MYRFFFIAFLSMLHFAYADNNTTFAPPIILEGSTNSAPINPNNVPETDTEVSIQEDAQKLVFPEQDIKRAAQQETNKKHKLTKNAKTTYDPFQESGSLQNLDTVWNAGIAHQEAILKKTRIPDTKIYKRSYTNNKNKHLPRVWYPSDYNKATIQAIKEGNLAAVSTLLRKIDNTEIADTDGNTLLMIAINQDQRDIVRLLLAQGSNIHAKNNRKISVEDTALASKHTQMIDLIKNTRTSS